MKHKFRSIIAVAIAVVLVSPAFAEAAGSPPLDEDAASDLLVRTLKHNHVYAKRISLGCIACGAEETTDAYFQFYVREIHNSKCGGDPELSPIVARYRVYRRSGKIRKWEAANDSWHLYKPAQDE